jgi:hypothetical protein
MADEHQSTSAVCRCGETTIELILLRHNLRRLYLIALAPQQGHRGRVFTSALINDTRMVAIEFGMWRSGRKGGSSGSITVG